MLERVARALCKHGEADCWETHMDDARAAVEAMRTPDMNLCMHVAKDTGLGGQHVDLAWARYIDAILAEVPT